MTLNVLQKPAAPPFYIWANEDCQTKSDSLDGAKAIRLDLVNDGCESVYICDANGVEVADEEICAHEMLCAIGVAIHRIGDRYVLVDPQDESMQLNDSSAYALALRAGGYYRTGIGPDGSQVKNQLLISDHEAALDEPCFWQMDQGWGTLRDGTRFIQRVEAVDPQGTAFCVHLGRHRHCACVGLAHRRI